MKKIFTVALTTFMLGSAFAQDNHRKHHQKSAKTESSHSKSPLVLNHGKKWTVDSVMKENMGAIHQQYKTFSTLLKSKKSSDKDALLLSTVISASTQNIISQCKMEQKQDQAFHVILADLLSVATDLEKSEKIESSLKNLKRALKNYTQYFDHSL